MNFFFFEPEVAGELGARSVLDRSSHPPRVDRLHYHFGGWLGDVVLESFPCFIGTEEAVEALKKIGASGVTFDNVETSVSEDFQEMYPGRILPLFRWLKVDGVAGKDDFGIGPDLRLVVSERVIDALRPLGIKNALMEKFWTEMS